MLKNVLIMLRPYPNTFVILMYIEMSIYISWAADTQRGHISYEGFSLIRSHFQPRNTENAGTFGR